MKNKRLKYGLFCIVAAFVFAIIGIPAFNALANRTVDVVCTTGHIAKGEEITEDMVKIVKMSARNLPEGVFATTKDVVSQYAKVDYFGGEMVLASHLNETALITDLSALPKDKVAMSFTVQTFAAGVSDKLKAGDIIRIYRVTKDSENGGMHSETIGSMQYVEVLAVTNKDGEDIQSEKVDENGETVANHASSITVILSENQARELAQYEYDSELHVALVFRGNGEDADKYIAMQDKINGAGSSDAPAKEAK